MEIHSNSSRNISVTENINKSFTKKAIIYSQNVTKIFESDLPKEDEITNEIDNYLSGKNADNQNFHCIVFIGYSGLGYKDPKKLKNTIKTEIDRCILDNPDKQVVVVCGGTRAGIGIVYDLVAEAPSYRERIKCMGIVSECVSEHDLIQGDVKIILVPDPKKTWQTINFDGDTEYQYMLYPVHKYGGEVIAFGGGGIGYKEINEAKKIGIETKLFPFEPDSFELKSKLTASKKYSDLCPIMYHEFGIKG